MSQDNIVRVLHVIGTMQVGGAPNFIMNVYRNIDRDKVQFDFLINDTVKSDLEDEVISMGGIIHRVTRRFPNYFKHLKCIDDFYRNNKQYNIVHQHTGGNLAISTIIYAKKHKIDKIVYHSHNSKNDRSIIGAIFDFIYKPQIKKYATHYFACSELAAKHLFGKYIGKSEIKIINNGIDTDNFAFNSYAREQKRQELEIKDKFVVGHIGRFATQKNHVFLIDIFNKVYEKNNNAVLLLVGDGELRGTIEDIVKEQGLANNVIFAGLRTDISDLLSAMDVFLFPSLYEGLPVILIEAQANGLHCILSDAISSEADITGLLEYVPLNESQSYWADKVLFYANGYKREDVRKKISKAGYDAKEVSSWLEAFYLNTSQNAKR